MKNNQIQTRANKPQQMIKKSLNSAFSSVHKHALVDSASYAGDGTPTFEIPEDKLEKESTENLLVENVNSPSLSGSSKVSSMAADLTPSSVITNNDSEEFYVFDGDEISELCSLKKHGLPEAELMAEYLKQARLQMLSSTGMDPRFKKLLDALVEGTVKEFCSLPDERDWMDELIASKSRILFVCFLMCLTATSVILLLLQFDIGGSSDYTPPPT